MKRPPVTYFFHRNNATNNAIWNINFVIILVDLVSSSQISFSIEVKRNQLFAFSELRIVLLSNLSLIKFFCNLTDINTRIQQQQQTINII